ncbi:MAG: DUF99 family protein [Halodesulfurarchaeum sp.]
MKSGVRALGVAESYRGDRSTIAGVVVRASRIVDGFSVSIATVGGLDATEAVTALYDRLDREDVRYVLLSGVAPAWFNILDLEAIHEHVDRPLLAVTYEESEGLESTIEAEFDGVERTERLALYRSLPPRREMTVNDETLFVRPVGVSLDEAEEILDAFTPEGGRPEPLRVARLAARAFDAVRHRENHEA